MVVDVYPSLEKALDDGLLVEDTDDFIPVKSYAVLWKPKIKAKEEAYGRIYISNPPKGDGTPKEPNQIPDHRIDPITNLYTGECDVPGCTKLHGWTSFRVDSPQEVSTILDILRNEKGIRFNPKTYAIKADWKPTIPKNNGGGSI